MPRSESVLPATAADSYAPDPPPPTVRRLFYGDDGLRAGWSFVLFLLLVFALSGAANLLISHFHLLPRPVHGVQSDLTAKTTLLGDGLGFLAAALAAALMSLLERRPFSRYGLTLRRMIPDLLAGLAWGLSALSALVATLFLTHSIAFDGLLLHGAEAFAYGLKWALAFLFVGFAEEFLTRGYIQFTVARGVSGIVRTMDPRNPHSHAIGFWVAAFIFSVCLFMAGHLGNHGETFAGIAAVGIAGAVFAFSLYRTGSLWWAIGFHTAWDWAQSFLYGTPDSGLHVRGHLLATHPTGSLLLSGGPTGPEGSVFVIPALLLVALAIHWTLPRRAYPLTPDQSPIDTGASEPLQPADEFALVSSLPAPPHLHSTSSDEPIRPLLP